MPDLLDKKAFLRQAPNVYKILCPKNDELIYVGEMSKLLSRFGAHVVKPRASSIPIVAYSQLLVDTPAYQRHGIENDLVAGYYALTSSLLRVPLLNYRKE